MPWALLVKPSRLPLQDPYTHSFFLLIAVLRLTDSELSCLAILAAPYSVSGQSTCPRLLTNPIACQKGAHEVLGTILVARLMSVFFIK